MNRLFSAVTTKDVLTENGMPTHSTSSNYILDMFFKMGGSRGMSEADIINMFERALNENSLLTTKALFYNRDIREGQGERRSFRVMFRHLCNYHTDIAKRNLHLVPVFGRWDDLLVSYDTPVWEYTSDLILSALKSGDKLCAKWMPRENKKNGNIAKDLAYIWGLSPKKYRTLLSGNTEVVESLMCSGVWELIDYNKVPSVAISKYRGAFYKHDDIGFPVWIESLSKPESGNKIHAGAIFPHDIVAKIMDYRNSLSDRNMLNEQWKALPDFVKDGTSFIPVCDVSGSMNGIPMAVSIALGIYLSERNKSIFKNGFITFSGRPTLQILSGDLFSRVSQLSRSQWEMNTNLEAVFNLILKKAIENHLEDSDLPKNILILSDMQFDACTKNNDDSVMDMIKRKYNRYGYTVPGVIFWNLRTSSGVPVKSTESGVALVSGFSPSVMTNILGGEFTPMSIMLKTLNSERYNIVT